MSSGNKYSWTPGYDYDENLQWVGVKNAVTVTGTLTSEPPAITTVTGALTVEPAAITTVSYAAPPWVYATTSGGESSLYTYATQTGAWAVGLTGGTVGATQSGVWSVGINTGARVAIASVSGTIGVSGAVAATQSGTWTVGLSGTTFVYATPSVASIIVSTYSASNAFATLVLAQPGAGLYHYITAINCRRVFHPGYTNVAATIQTTNMNSLRIICPPIGSITDTTQDFNMTFNPPLRVQAADTATNIGMVPAGTNIKWSAWCVYYTGA